MMPRAPAVGKKQLNISKKGEKSENIVILKWKLSLFRPICAFCHKQWQIQRIGTNAKERRKDKEMRNFKSLIALILCIVLIAATALFAVGCKTTKGETPETTDAQTTEADTTEADEADEPEEDSATVLGEGEKQFTFTVVDAEGNETAFTINTDKETVGDALLELELIEGEDGDYGLYVKKVNGIVADYDVDKTYWAFYVNGEYAMNGVDSTNIENGAEYSFKIEK